MESRSSEGEKGVIGIVVVLRVGVIGIISERSCDRGVIGVNLRRRRRRRRRWRDGVVGEDMAVETPRATE